MSWLGNALVCCEVKLLISINISFSINTIFPYKHKHNTWIHRSHWHYCYLSQLIEEYSAGLPRHAVRCAPKAFAFTTSTSPHRYAFTHGWREATMVMHIAQMTKVSRPGFEHTPQWLDHQNLNPTPQTAHPWNPVLITCVNECVLMIDILLMGCLLAL